MSITEKLLQPLVKENSARPLITYYDDAVGIRIELSRATVANWAAKTANWLRDELDVVPGTPITVQLPAHWQTMGVLLGAWWCGAAINTDQGESAVAFTAAHNYQSVKANTVAVVALDAWGRGLDEPPQGTVDYITEVRAHGDDFFPWEPVPDSTLALDKFTIDELITFTHQRTVALELDSSDRVLSTMDWTSAADLIDGMLAMLSSGAALVQCTNIDLSKLPSRRESEKITRELP